MYNDSDPQVRSIALSGAQHINDPRADAIMIKALDDPDEGIRSGIAGKLGSKGVKSAAPKLIKALDDPNPRVRRHAARSLRNLTGTDYSDRIEKPTK